MTTQLAAYMNAIDYKVTDGSEFLWDCFGPNARFLDRSDDDYHVSAVFDNRTHQVYEVSISSTYDGDVRYRWIDLNFINDYKAEAENKGTRWDQFCDDMNWHLTDTYEDILDKVECILNGREYDKRVVLSLEFDDDVKEMIQQAADIQGITIDEFIERALKAVIEEEKE